MLSQNDIKKYIRTITCLDNNLSQFMLFFLLSKFVNELILYLNLML